MSLLTDTLEKIKTTEDPRVKEIEALYQEVKEVYDCEELSVEQKYDAIFTFAREKGIYKLHFGAEAFSDYYYDPDTSYEEDLYAFMSAFESFIKAIKK